jgi:hypothetical protein
MDWPARRSYHARLLCFSVLVKIRPFACKYIYSTFSYKLSYCRARNARHKKIHVWSEQLKLLNWTKHHFEPHQYTHWVIIKYNKFCRTNHKPNSSLQKLFLREGNMLGLMYLFNHRNRALGIPQWPLKQNNKENQNMATPGCGASWHHVGVGDDGLGRGGRGSWQCIVLCDERMAWASWRRRLPARRLIRLQCTYNFWCSMLVFTLFA